MRNVRQEMVLPSWCDADIPAISGVIARLSELGRAVALVDALHEPVERGGNARRALWSGIGPLGDFAPAGLAGLVWGGISRGPTSAAPTSPAECGDGVPMMNVSYEIRAEVHILSTPRDD